jgi:DNA polymerase-4
MEQLFRLKERSVLHFNVADFAVAVERVSDNSLKEKPLIIAPLQAARPLVYDMSEEAFREGVRKGMGLKQAIRRCRQAAILIPRIPLYQKAMAAFLKELQNYSPLIEHGRADGHFFVDVTGTHRLLGPAPDVGWRVRRHVKKGLGINPIWALGSNKLIAKVASRLVKPVGEYIVTPGEEDVFLAPLPVELLPGVTPRELEKLMEFRLTTIGALAGMSRNQLMVPFGSRCDFLHGLSHGVDESKVSDPRSAPATIDYEHLFDDDTNNRREVEGIITKLASRAGHQLREQQQVSRRVGVWLRYTDGGHVVRQASLKKGTSGDFLLHELALTALERAWVRRTRIRSCRLVCDRFQRKSPQLPLFPEPTKQNKQEEQVLGAVDQLRNRFGHEIIGLGRQFHDADSSAGPASH